MSQTASISNNTALRWAGMLLISAIIGAFMHFSGFEYKIVAFTTLTTMALVCWALELLPDALVATVLPIMYIVFSVAPSQRVLGPWTGSIGWWVLGGMMIGVFLMKTGLSRRLSLRCINLVGRSFLFLMFGIMLSGILLAMILPSVMGRAAVLCVLCVGICETLDVAKGSREGAAIIIAGLIATAAGKMCFLSGGGDLIMSMRLTTEITGEAMTWMQYAIHNTVPALFYSIMSILCAYFVLRPSMKGDIRQSIRPHLEALGSMSTAEKKATLLLLVLCALMLTDKYHGIDVGWFMLLIPSMAFLPGIDLLNTDDFKKLNFPVVIFTVGCMTIGSAATACGMDKVASAVLIPLLSGSEFYTVIMTYISGASLNFLFTPLAATAAMTTTVANIAQAMNINPLMLVYSFNFGLEQYIFPYEYAVVVYFYATGYLKSTDIVKVFGTRMILAAAFVAFIAYPYWKFIL